MARSPCGSTGAPRAAGCVAAVHLQTHAHAPRRHHTHPMTCRRAAQPTQHASQNQPALLLPPPPRLPQKRNLTITSADPSSPRLLHLALTTNRLALCAACALTLEAVAFANDRAGAGGSVDAVSADPWGRLVLSNAFRVRPVCLDTPSTLAQAALTPRSPAAPGAQRTRAADGVAFRGARYDGAFVSDDLAIRVEPAVIPGGWMGGYDLVSRRGWGRLGLRVMQCMQGLRISSGSSSSSSRPSTSPPPPPADDQRDAPLPALCGPGLPRYHGRGRLRHPADGAPGVPRAGGAGGRRRGAGGRGAAGGRRGSCGCRWVRVRWVL
jgi:hypothetical protein